MRGGRMRKQWRYIGVYGPELMLCAASVRIGPVGQTFWSLWDRAGGATHGATSMLPGRAGVELDGSRLSVKSDGVAVRLRLGEAAPVEAVCASGERGFGWTRKRAGLTVSGTVDTPEGHRELTARGIDDESAGYHQRHTSWRWSAGVGRALDGRELAWNLVEGINDPPHDSERAVWLDGQPYEPAPVRFTGLEAVDFGARGRLAFTAESERARDDNMLVFRSSYRHRFGTFSGSLDGIELGEGFGVMESHEAVW